MMKIKRKLAVGQRVYEVFIYKVRPAVVTDARTVTLEGPKRERMTVYTIECDDGSLSPRYYESDVGVALFESVADAEKKCEENKKFRSRIGSRGLYGGDGFEERALAELGYLIRRANRPARRRYRPVFYAKADRNGK